MPSHAESRKKVCALCYNQRGKKIQAQITPGSKVERAIKALVDEDFSATDLHTPCSNISTLKLSEFEKIRKLKLVQWSI